ncbi:MAG: L-serine ammonia-lyase, iron-sulfur-dependent, subunit alpha [Bacillota bacterium]
MADANDVRTVLLELLRQHSQSAAVCTEPASIALASARGCELLGERPEQIDVYLSPGVMKNAGTAGLPAGNRRGPEVAAALGAALQRSQDGLDMLLRCTADDVDRAYRMVDRGIVAVHKDFDCDVVFVRAVIRGAQHTVEVVISGSHSCVREVWKDDARVPVSAGEDVYAASLEPLKGITLNGLLDVAGTISEEESRFLLRGARSNLAVAERASEEYCLSSQETGPIPLEPGLCLRVRELVMAAICARMKGVPRPVFTSGGSGNQGLMVSVPILCMAELLQASDARILKALVLAHSVNLYSKAFIGELSDVCGAVGAGAGVAGAVCQLLGGSDEEVARAVNAMITSLYGMVCDGAKVSCSLKGATAAVEGLNAGWMAVSGSLFPDCEGVTLASIGGV